MNTLPSVEKGGGRAIGAGNGIRALVLGAVLGAAGTIGIADGTAAAAASAVPDADPLAVPTEQESLLAPPTDRSGGQQIDWHESQGSPGSPGSHASHSSSRY